MPIRAVSVLLFSASVSLAQAQYLTFGDWEYKVNGSEAEITRYLGQGGDVAIPSSVNGLPVTQVGGYAYVTIFGNQVNYSVTSISIPSGVRTIGWAAFKEGKALKKIKIPNSITRIEDWAFAETAIRSITIPESVTSTGGDIFWGCANLSAILFLGNAPEYRGTNPSNPVQSIETPLTVYVLPASLGWGATYLSRPVVSLSDLVGLYNQSQYESNRENGRQDVINSPNLWALYTVDQIQNMAMGNLVLNKNINGTFTLNYDVEQSTDLQTWAPYQALSLPLSGLPTNKAFVRIKIKNSQTSSNTPVISGPTPP